MIYVFDSNSLSNIINHYYPGRFPTFWEKFEEIVQRGEIVSVREVRNELTGKYDESTIAILMKSNQELFSTPTSDELSFITKIYSVPHFQQNLEKKKILTGGFFADPFV
ncbi:MAG: DUF4411 family protein [Ignavibacteriaceae bacterium]|nr:DUF4411 family protein [Ignavibacteriaceae bacterium]